MTCEALWHLMGGPHSGFKPHWVKHEQDTHWFTEPPPWYFPVRQALGAVLLQARRPADAEKIYREDLARNPDNGWSLFGLAQSLRAQDRTAEAMQAEERFRRAWARADVSLTASRF